MFFGNKKILAIVFFLCVTFFYCESVSAQKIGIKTNVLYDATATINLGVEFAVSENWTLDISGNYNGWNFRENRKWKHFLIQPEARYWLCEKFNGHFFGLHAHGGEFNNGNVWTPPYRRRQCKFLPADSYIPEADYSSKVTVRMPYCGPRTTQIPLRTGCAISGTTGSSA